MKTSLTNRIRYVLDELLPPFLRNARWFMTPLFAIWFKGRNVRLAMDFKRVGPSLSDQEFRDVYRGMTTLADGRITDTHSEAAAYAVASIDSGAQSLLDVGCGRGFFLGELRKARAFKALYGCDLRERVDLGPATYLCAMAERLPFADRSIDVVTCFHTLEHARDLAQAVAELKRVAKRQLIVIVPRQRRLEYTFDFHLQFFETPQALGEAMGPGGDTIGTVRQFGDDLVYISGPS